MDEPGFDLKTREMMITELAEGTADLLTIGQRHGLSPEATAAWAAQAKNTAWLEQLTDAADRHTQWLVSRYRLNVASAMLGVISQEQAKPADVVRAATLMLRLNLDQGTPNTMHEAMPLNEDDAKEIRVTCYGTTDPEAIDADD